MLSELIGSDLYVLANETNEGSGFCLIGIRVSIEPFVRRPKRGILWVPFWVHVRSLGKNNEDFESAAVNSARSIMQRCRIDFHGRSGGNAEGFYLLGVELIVDNIEETAKEKDEVLICEVDFAASMVFKAIELLVMAVAIAELDGHVPVDVFFEGFDDLFFLKTRVARRIDRTLFRHRRVFQQFEHAGVISLQNPPEFCKTRIKYAFDFHCLPLEWVLARIGEIGGLIISDFLRF